MSYSKRRDSKVVFFLLEKPRKRTDDINTGIAMVLVVEELFTVGD